MNESDLVATISVLKQFVENPELKYQIPSNPQFKEIFSLVHALVPTKQDSKAHVKDKKRAKKQADHDTLSKAAIRNRMRAHPLIGKPPVFETLFELEKNSTSNLPSNLLSPSNKTKVDDAKDTMDQDTKDLNYARSCHICYCSFRQLHPFYDQLCPECAAFNFEKRSSKADMNGRVCLVTGARVKIGFQVALKLLRMGAVVIATTRFPHDAANRYALEPDFPEFGKRLFIHGIDFRDIKMVHHFAEYVRSNFNRLDVIINNAAQTVRKPPKYYEHMIQTESEPLSPKVLEATHVLDIYKSNNRYISHPVAHSAEPSMTLVPFSEAKDDLVPHSAAALSQLPILPEDSNVDDSLFPKGVLDEHNQQLDLRRENSWVLEIGQISTVELIECHLINAFAPWVLISELKSMLEATLTLPLAQEGLCDKYIVNVSAMEGIFYRTKSSAHPHSNMAKAALNMLTRTSAQSMMELNIFMTAVDTGWITDENPVHEWEKRVHNPPPLDETDAAMRILDPVLAGIRGESKLFGVFLKNYKPSRW